MIYTEIFILEESRILSRYMLYSSQHKHKMASFKSTILSPLDQLMPPCYIRIFLVFETNNHEDGIQSLAQGLGKLTKLVPYIRGRVFRAEEEDRWAIRCSDDDADPELKERMLDADERMPSYSDLQKSHAPLCHFDDSLSPLPVVSTEREAPVFAASYTRLDGALLMCYCVHHNVMDGTGAAELAGLWAACARGEDVDQHDVDPQEPFHRAALLDVAGAEPDSSVPAQVHTGVHAHLARPREPLPSTAKIVSFSTERLVKTRAALERARAGSPSASTGPISTNTVLNAVIWSTVTRIRLARLARDGQRDAAGSLALPSSSRLSFAVDGRRRLGGDFCGRARFLGNVNVNSLAEADLHTLAAASRYVCATEEVSSGDALGALARVVEAVSSAAARNTRSYIRHVVSRVQQASSAAQVALDWQISHELDLTLTSWANQGFYEFDFGRGLGKPSFVRVPYMEADGLVIILPRRRGGPQERIEALVGLNVDDLQALESDAAWNSWCY